MRFSSGILWIVGILSCTASSSSAADDHEREKAKIYNRHEIVAFGDTQTFSGTLFDIFRTFCGEYTTFAETGQHEALTFAKQSGKFDDASGPFYVGYITWEKKKFGVTHEFKWQAYVAAGKKNGSRGDRFVATVENAHNPGWYLTHTGPAARGEQNRLVKIDSKEEDPNWPVTAWTFHPQDDGTYTIENRDAAGKGNKNWFLTHTGPAHRSVREPRVLRVRIDSTDDNPNWTITPWRLIPQGNDQYLIENVHNPGYYLTHTGPAKKGGKNTEVKIDGADPTWEPTPWIIHRQ